MALKLPQEIEVWYIIPALRKALALQLIRSGLTQKDVAKLLDITDAAVSQYKTKKRAEEIAFDDETLRMINESAARIKAGDDYRKEMITLCDRIKHTKAICQIHKKYDSSLPHNCDLCTMR